MEETKNTARKMKVVALELLFGVALGLYCGICGYGILSHVVPNLLGEPTLQVSVARAMGFLGLVMCSFWVMFVVGGMLDELRTVIAEREGK